MPTTQSTVVTPLPAPGPAEGPRLLRSLTWAMARLARWRLLLGSGAVFVAFAAVFFASSAPFAIPRVETTCGQAPPDVRFTSSAADIMRFLDACGPVGREAYRHLQVADLLYPAVFGFFMATCLALVVSRLAPARPGLLVVAALPLLGAAFDYLENICAWLAMTAYPVAAATNSLLGLASAAKNITFWTAGVLLLAALGMRGAAGVIRARRPPRADANAGPTGGGRR
ncbi:hypothetical protein [Intrasporangium sp. YIM S08009]|uniref:hypothetical protein n=1 Tax=Intrasporangium zincisolvens TaxID=3080018 RepID=UPI002B0522DD|nr:hypothetical protein [Intrasporangium sp. YIM S08009]